MSAPEKGREEIAARISGMASEIYGVPEDAFGRKTADECARMLRILSGMEVDPADEPFLPPLEEAGPDEGAK